MNWTSEAHKSWEWLQWMREVVAEGTEPHGCLVRLINGMNEWDEAIARDRHSVGDPDRIQPKEHFVFAASWMSRAAKLAIARALRDAQEWGVDDPMGWPSEPEKRRIWVAEAKEHWAAAHHVVTVTLQAWITLWNDLADQKPQGTLDVIRASWMELADQASEIVSGAATAAWAQTH